MEWGDYENGIAVIALYNKVEQTRVTFSIHSKNSMLIKRFTTSNSLFDTERSSRPITVRTSNAIHAVQEQIRRNPLRNRRSWHKRQEYYQDQSQIIKTVIGIGAYKRRASHLLTTSLNTMRLIKPREFIRQHVGGGY